MTHELLQKVVDIINAHPQLCPQIEHFAKLGQGKGYGTNSIQLEIAIVLELLQKPINLAVDIGGNVGDYTAELRNKNLKTEIHVFEPAQTNVDKLTDRFIGDNLITINPVAVSNKNEIATLFANEAGSGLGSLTKRKLDFLNIPFDHQESVKTIRFEDYWKDDLNQRHIDLVKLDIEGHEMDALVGFGDAINHINAIQFEFGGCNIDTRTYFKDFWYFFSGLGFSLYRITPFGYTPIQSYEEAHETFTTTNYIALKL